ncbi:Uncharacterised protein [Bacteroides pyogenes]|nr:Uncharacterised protein [Bacteroides pyogenes]
MKSRKILSLFIGCLVLKFLLFDLDWCLNTTFSSFSFPQTYLSRLLLASLLAVPLTFIRSRWYCAIVASLVDILLVVNLIGADDYPWRGLGRSILSPDKKGFAISSQMEIIGDTTGVSPAELQHARDAWRVSDLMICCDYFAR